MKLSLRWKIVGGFGVVLALVAILSWVTFSLFGSLRSVQRRVFDNALPGLVATDEIIRSYTAQSGAIRGFVIRPSQTGLLAQYRSEVEIADLYERRAEELFTSNEERSLLAQLVHAGQEFHSLVDDQVVPRTEEGDRSGAIRILGQDGDPLINEIERLGTLLRDVQDRTVVSTEADVRSHANQTVVILLLVTIGVVSAGIILAVVLSRRFVENLSLLVDAARAIGRGDLDQKLEIHSGDEVEELAERFTEMQSGLKRLQQLALQDRELEIASSIQQNLLQRSIPTIAGVTLVPHQRQANLVGGDWYDVDVQGSALTVAVGDASGKGIAAALMATVTLSALRAERGFGSEPVRVVERANRALKDATDADSFTTLIYATLDTASGRLSWLNMGHPAPFLLRARPADQDDGAHGYYLEGPRNRVLGWFDHPGFELNDVLLEPGDRVMLFTDGFLEAKSPEGEVFGEHRMAEALTRFGPLDPNSVAGELIRAVETHAAGKLDDDLTVLVIEFTGSSARGEVARADDLEEEAWHSRR
ncbi:MAG TPA: SpoIIE family protein phosphatase [Actinomycetota bacterium]|nr:SpoIIE family protein phosphatase [Actinomycetota bacterium]